MKLNSIYTKAAVCALAALSFTACNGIDEDDRYIETPIVEVSKHVLIEDFTGQLCINCPNASITIGQIQELYGADNVIAVAIHSGPFSKTLSGTPLSLWTEAGDHYYNTYASGASQPAGIIDRRSGVQNTFSLWPTFVEGYLQMTTPLTLGATTQYDASTRTVTIDVTASSTDNVDGSLQVWLTENNIIDIQAMPDGSMNMEYEHNHVLRAAVNGNDGEAFPVSYGAEKTATYTYQLDEDWKAENMHVVAFVYNSNGVEQVISVPVIASEGGDAEGGSH